MDEVRAAVAVAMGHPGCRARVHAGASGELAGVAPFRDVAPPAAREGEGVLLTVKGYSRLKKKDKEPAPPRAPAPRAPPARAAPPGSPGFRRRNYIRETEDALGDAGGDDPLAAPVGGHRARAPIATVHARSDTRGTLARDRTTVRVAPGTDELWTELNGEADAARAAEAETNVAGAGAGDGAGAGAEDGAGDGDGDGDDIGHKDGDASVPVSVPVPRRRKRRRAPPSPSPAPSASSALPPSLERLARGYEAATAMCAFLRSQRMRSTWRHVSSATRGAVSLDDLRAMATLAPASLRLTPVIVAETDDAGVLIGDGGDDADTLVEPTDPDRLPRDADGPEGLPQPRVAVHGARTSAKTYAAESDEEDGDQGDEGGDGSGSKDIPGGVGFGRNPTPGRTSAATRRKVSAFRSRLGRLVVATVDAAMDDEEMDATAAWARADAATLDDYLVFAEGTRGFASDAPSPGPDAPPDAHPHGNQNPHPKNPKPNPRARGRCVSTAAMTVDAFVSHLTEGEDALGARGDCVRARLDFPPRVARFASTAPNLSPATVAALAAVGVPARALFAHQSVGVSAALAGDNVVVATGTASGKSVCYNAPALEAMLHDPNATTMYVFPTKALARDQLRALTAMLDGAARATYDDPAYADAVCVPDVGVYDGDTPEEERRRVRAEARAIFTNPDMLHASVLPNHREWAATLRGLRYVVLDEAHVYRGVFGSHVALVMRRLRRVCREAHGVDPTFVVASATIADPAAHASDLVGRFPKLGADEKDARGGWTVVEEDGSPCGAKTFLMWNPPTREDLKPAGRAAKTRRRRRADRHPDGDPDAPRGKAAVAARLTRAAGEKTSIESNVSAVRAPRVSPIVEMAHLLAECVRHDLRCIAFCKTKKLCELVLRYAREHLDGTGAGHLRDAVRAYRGGYSASDRRATEGALFGGELRGVAATNALELGVDVGHLDATLHLGFPGSVASLTQQAGRAGRRGGRALGVYVAFDSPLDQRFLREPERLFGKPTERAAIDPNNARVLAAHAACAAHEIPLDPRLQGEDARTYFGAALPEACAGLIRARRLGRDPTVSRDADERLRWIGSSLKTSGSPRAGVSIRTVEEERYVVKLAEGGAIVEEIEASKAFWSVYPGAVYMNQARTYLCLSLDATERVAVVRPADVKYFTQTVDKTWIDLVEHAGSTKAYPDRPAPGISTSRSSSAAVADADVRIRFEGFRKVHASTGRAFDDVDFARDMGVRLPEVSFRTVASWVRIPDAARVAARDAGMDFVAGVHAAAHAVINVLPMYVMADQSDVAAECFAGGGDRYRPARLLLYDRHPGGVGIAQQAAPIFLHLLRAALELVEGCECGAGSRPSNEDADGRPSNEDADASTAATVDRTGCPQCTHYASCDQYNVCLDAAAAATVLRATIAAEAARDEAARDEAGRRRRGRRGGGGGARVLRGGREVSRKDGWVRAERLE